MAELAKFETMVLYNTSGAITVGANAKAIVFKEGATVNTTQTILAAGSTAITVFDIGQFVAGDYAKVGPGGSVTGTVASTGGTTTITFNGTGTDIALADGTRLIRLGTNAAGTAPGTLIYNEDQGTSTALTNSVVTADSNGNMKFWSSAGDYDVLVQNTAQTSDLYLIQDVTLNLMLRSSTVTYITNPGDDFAVGGSTTAAPLFFDTSAELLTIGGTAAPYVAIDGANGKVTIVASTDPQLVLQGASTTTLKSAATSARIYTFPDVADGTVVVTTGAQTLTGAKTFTGGVTISTAAATISSALTLSGAVTSTGGITASAGNINFLRLIGDQGSALASGNFVSPSNCTFTSVVGTDNRFFLTISASAGATHSIQCNFNTAFSNAPFAVAALDSTSAAAAVVNCTTTTSSVVLTVNSATTGTYKIHCIVMG